MYMKNWAPRITTSAIYKEACLHFISTLKCPCCKTEIKVTTKSYMVMSQRYTSLPDDIERCVDELVTQRACIDCGTVSIMPSKDHRQLDQEAKNQITDLWVQEQAAKVGAKIGADTCIHNSKKRSSVA